MATWPTNGSQVDTWDTPLLAWLTDKVFASDGTFKDNFEIDTSFTVADACNIGVGTTTGTQIGTATGQKIGFYGATPVDQAGNTEDLKDVLIALGLIAGGAATPLDLDGGALSCGNLTLADAANIAVGTTTGTQIGTATSQKIGFYGATPIDQAGNTEDLKDVLIALGFIAGGGATPLDLDGGQLTSGNAYPGTDDTYYLGKNSISSPLAWKGLVLKDTTDGNYYLITSVSGAVTITQIT